MRSIRKKPAIFTGLLLAVALIVMVLLPKPGLATDYPITLTDDLGREVTFETPPEKIISLAPSNTEILFALDLGDRVVAVTDYCDYPEEALDKPKIGGPWTPSIEDIVALEPDLVLAADINPIDVITTLENLGLTVFGIKSTDLDDLLDDINTIGRITDKEARAEAVTRQMQYKIDFVTERTNRLSSEEKPRVFYIVWHDPIWTTGEGTFAHDLIEMAGGINIFADLEGWQAVSLETLIDRDPEVIIVTAMGGEGSDTWDWVNTEERLANISARQNGRIYYIESNWLERPGPRITYGLVELTKRLHPGIFKSSERRSERRYYIKGNIFGEELNFRVSQSGEVEKTIKVTSGDERLTVTIGEGTIAKNEDGKPLKSLEMTIDEDPPSPPKDAHIIGSAYSFGPGGAEFDPPITLEFSYDPEAIAEGVAEEDLVIAYYDENEHEWVELKSSVDTEANTITATVGHFTTFAIIGYEEEEVPSEAAIFNFSSLAISPNEVNVGEEVAITITVANTANKSGSCEITLKINGEVEATKEVDIAGGSSQQVSFTISKDAIGIYVVEVGGLTGSFLVREMAPSPPPLPPSSPPTEPVNWWLIGGIIAAVATGIAVTLRIRRRRED